YATHILHDGMIFFSSRRRHTRSKRDWSSDVCSSDLMLDQLDIEKLLDPPLISKYIPMTRWALLYQNKGLYKGDKLEEWLEEKLALKGIETFAHIKENDLKIVVSDISLGKLIVIPDDLNRVYGVVPEQFKVATAVRMSASFPYFFMPKKLYYSKTYSYIVDGGLLSNFP